MDSTQRLFCLATAASVIAAPAHANPPPPPPLDSTPAYSMTEVATLVVESTDVIIEGMLVDIVPQAIYSTSGLCTWVAELVFTPSQIIKGKGIGDSLHAWTMTMPDDFDISIHHCGQAHVSETVPLPPIGAQGVFRLNKEHSWLGVMEEALVFDSTPASWLQPPLAAFIWSYKIYEFPYDEFVPALIAANNRERVKRTEPTATFIAVLNLGPYDERKHLRNENGTLTVRFPVTVKEVLRGTISSSSAYIDLVEPPDVRENPKARMELGRQRHLGPEFYRLQSRRVLAMGSCSDSVITIDPGMFEITDQDSVLFGVSDRASLSELRTRLR